VDSSRRLRAHSDARPSGETIAADGAGFLTDGAAVTLPKPRAAAEKDRRSLERGDKGAKKS